MMRALYHGGACERRIYALWAFLARYAGQSVGWMETQTTARLYALAEQVGELIKGEHADPTPQAHARGR